MTNNGKDLKSAKWDGAVQQSAWFRTFDRPMSEQMGQKARVRKLLEGEARWSVTSITIEFHPDRPVAQLSAIDSPLRVRFVPALAYQDQNRRRKVDIHRSPPDSRTGSLSVVKSGCWIRGQSNVQPRCVRLTRTPEYIRPD
jgi:hypothetical protein